MENKQSHPSTPDFGTLTGILERFLQVPYERFLQELDDRLGQTLAEKGIDLQQALRLEGLAFLPQLVSFINHEAAVKPLLNDQSLTDEPRNDQA